MISAWEDGLGYTDAFIGSLELRWGEGFLCPGFRLWARGVSIIS